MKKLDKIASQDAFRWARAEMFFGDGAGTRRRLVEAEINQKMKDIPGYKAAFMAWYEKQDMAEHAIAAAKERQKIDRSIRVHRNTRALVRGDRRSMTTGVAILFTAAVIANQTGYDKVIIEKTQQQYRRLRLRLATYNDDKKKDSQS